ncbi:U-box domain-containing protein 12 [Linum grandiflorum]
MMLSARRRETIVAYVSDLRSDAAVEFQLKALKTLDSITKVSPQNRNLIAETEDALPNLYQMADMETIQHLNSLVVLSTTSTRLAAVCSFICSLAMLDKNKAKFGVAGTVQVLVNAIFGNRKDLATHHLLSCLAELVQFHGNCTLAVRAGAVKALVGIVDEGEEDVAGMSLAILSLVCRFEEGLTVLINTKDVVRFLMEGLKTRCVTSKESSADILLKVMDESEECLRDAFELPELSSVLADMYVTGSSKARDKAAQLMKKMTHANFDDTSFAQETSLIM